MLGRALAARSTGQRPVVALGRDQLDITDRGAIERIADETRCVAIVNAAAMTDVDGCERNPEAARRANVDGPARLAEVCRDLGLGLVHISTDFVFDGAKHEPYTIEDAPNPISVYGQTKLDGELAVRDCLPEALVVRTSSVFGVGGKNFASRVFEYLERTKILKGFTDMRSSPTYAPDLACRVLELLDLGVSGTYHVTGQGDASPFEALQLALTLAGRTDVEATPTLVADMMLPARRPAYSVLRCLLSERLHLQPLRPWQSAMAEFVQRAAQGSRTKE